MPYKNPEDRKAYMKKYFIEHRDQFKGYYNKSYAANPEKWHKWTNERKARLKAEICLAYGSKCVCCNEAHSEFLTIDHIEGGGHKHRKEMGGHVSFYYWLRRQGFPKDKFRLLCMNCNFSFGMYGYCPHNKPETVETIQPPS